MSSITKNKTCSYHNDIINALTALSLPCIQLHELNNDRVTEID